MKKNINGDELRKKAAKVDLIGCIYEEMYRSIQWSCMICTEDTDEDGNHIFLPPEKEDNDNSGYLTQYEKYMIYQDALAAIEKLAAK